MLLLLLLQSKIDLCDAASLSLLSLGAAVLCALANACRWNLVWGINRAFDGRVAKATCRESTACCLVIWPQWLLCGMVEGLAFFLFTQSNVVIGSSEVGCQSFTSAPLTVQPCLLRTIAGVSHPWQCLQGLSPCYSIWDARYWCYLPQIC